MPYIVYEFLLKENLELLERLCHIPYIVALLVNVRMLRYSLSVINFHIINVSIAFSERTVNICRAMLSTFLLYCRVCESKVVAALTSILASMLSVSSFSNTFSKQTLNDIGEIVSPSLLCRLICMCNASGMRLFV